MTIRAAGAGDASGIQSVADETWRASYAAILPEEAIGQFLVDAYSVAEIGRRIDRADHFEVAVSDVGESVIGFSEWLVAPGPDDAVWAAVYVRPAWQKRGIGRRFLLNGIAVYRDRLARLVVVVAEANAPGVAFFRAMGFIPVERVSSGIVGTPIAALRMAMLLR